MHCLFRIAIALMLCFAPCAASAEIIILRNGDVLNGRIVSRSKDRIVIKHADLGTIAVRKERIASLMGVSSAERSRPAQPVAEDGFIVRGFLAGWKRKLELGLNGVRGNAQNLHARAAFNANYEDHADRWKYQMIYSLSENDNRTSQNEFHTLIAKDWLMPHSEWFYFALGRYEWDDFEDWNHRLSFSTGPGYEFVDTPTWYLRGRLGVGASRTFGGSEDRLIPEGLGALEGGWQISDHEALTLSTTFNPRFEDVTKYRNITTADWEIALDRFRGLSLKLGFQNEYESDVPMGTEHNDLKYYLAFVLGI